MTELEGLSVKTTAFTQLKRVLITTPIATVKVIGEDGLPYVGNINIDISVAGDVITGNFTNQFNFNVIGSVTGIPPHSITVSDSDLSKTAIVTPSIGQVITLALTRTPITAIDLEDGIGNIASIESVQNATVSDSTGWDTEGTKAVSFPASGGQSDEPLFYFARQAGHVQLSADITYTFASTGRTVTERFENIRVAP